MKEISNRFNLDQESKRELQVKASLKYFLSFTLLNEDPDTHLVDWNFAKAEQTYLAFLLQKLSTVLELQVESQIIHSGILPEKPNFVENDKSFEIRAQDIKRLLNENDWKFGMKIFL